MKLVFFDDYRLGVLRDDGVVDVSGAVADLHHHTAQEPPRNCSIRSLRGGTTAATP